MYLTVHSEWISHGRIWGQREEPKHIQLPASKSFNPIRPFSSLQPLVSTVILSGLLGVLCVTVSTGRSLSCDSSHRGAMIYTGIYIEWNLLCWSHYFACPRPSNERCLGAAASANGHTKMIGPSGPCYIYLLPAQLSKLLNCISLSDHCFFELTSVCSVNPVPWELPSSLCNSVSLLTKNWSRVQVESCSPATELAALRPVREMHQLRNTPDNRCFSGENSAWHGLIFQRMNHISSTNQSRPFECMHPGFGLVQILNK